MNCFNFSLSERQPLRFGNVINFRPVLLDSGLYNLAEAEDDGGQLLASASLISHQRTAGGSQILLRG